MRLAEEQRRAYGKPHAGGAPARPSARAAYPGARVRRGPGAVPERPAPARRLGAGRARAPTGPGAGGHLGRLRADRDAGDVREDALPGDERGERRGRAAGLRPARRALE
ncbi:hypothetical protein TBS_00300 [Thermobispora bispora]